MSKTAYALFVTWMMSNLVYHKHVSCFIMLDCDFIYFKTSGLNLGTKTAMFRV